ncbi:MAG: 3-dehydroquinate synthase [Myxococcota bacterium]|nr:3-dehydroquinate synthase [Myxococcota bacterium]
MPSSRSKTSLFITPTQQDHAYRISIDAGWFPQLSSFLPLSTYSKVVILSDENVARHWYTPHPSLHQYPLIQIPAGESFKNGDTLEYIQTQMLRFNMDRRSLLINLGGGVVGDIGGFAASTYMRGMDFVQIPTTLLAQVDASIGGKVGINWKGYKNMLGVFVQPKAVLIDVHTLSTLPPRELRAGMAEVIKHGLVWDEAYFQDIGLNPSYESNWIDIIRRSCEIKASVVEKDTLETGLRKILNFGHTLGHAIESLSQDWDKPLLHGEAVALGMLGEAHISVSMNRLSEEQFQTIERALRNTQLPIRIPHTLIWSNVEEKIASDKKKSGNTIYWTLLRGIGAAEFNVRVPSRFVKEAFQYLQQP